MKKLTILLAILFSFFMFDTSVSQQILERETIRKGNTIFEVEMVREIVKNNEIHIPDGYVQVTIAKGWRYDNIRKLWTDGSNVKTVQEMMRDGKARIERSTTWKKTGYYHVYNTTTREIRVYLVGFSNNHKRTIYKIKDEKRDTVKISNSIKALDDSRARVEFNRRRVGFRPVITTLPSGTSLNVGPVVVSQDRRYIRMSINPFFSSITGVNTFTFRR